MIILHDKEKFIPKTQSCLRKISVTFIISAERGNPKQEQHNKSSDNIQHTSINQHKPSTN